MSNDTIYTRILQKMKLDKDNIIISIIVIK